MFVSLARFVLRTLPRLTTAGLLLIGASVQAAPPSLPTLIPSPPEINARAGILMDARSGAVLAEKNADERLAPASLTKIMTSYIVFAGVKDGSLHLDDEVRVSEKAWRTGGSRMFIREGSKVRLEDLVRGTVISSGNDATVALAEHIAGSEDAFAELMNHYAQHLGMQGSHFTDSNGLPDENHYTTARDMALLSVALIRDFPELYKIYSEKEFTFGKDPNGRPITQKNRNLLLWRDERVDGIKTGHTEEAGYSLAASAVEDNTRFITVVLGTDSMEARAQETQKLLNYGFRFFETRKVISAGDAAASVRVWKGESENLAAGPARDIWLTLPRNGFDSLQTEVLIHDHVEAPITQGQTLGSLRVVSDGKVMDEVQLQALESMPEGGLWDSAVDSIKLWFN
jgi:D-alanyl-D-alanine carboxypeptidase (penicillin-binding protein 5/6)